MNSSFPLLHLVFLLIVGQYPQATELPPPRIGIVVGNAGSYTVKRGDSLTSVGARLGIPLGTLARANGLRADARLQVGQDLLSDNRHVVPALRDDGILINVPQRLLFYFEMGTLVAWYPLALGAADWQTPLGTLHVASKETDPVWDVPVSIQEEMRRKGQRVKKRVAPGPDNPLGKFWMGLTPGSCGIHATNAPASIYRFRTHGCIRLHPDDAADLFSRVTIGTPVDIVYEPVLLARTGNGRIFLEVHPDVYERAPDARESVRQLADRNGLTSDLDPDLVEREIRESAGVAREIPSRAPR
ncbi:MAG TPA: L,D-transpeptidase family protein [Thermoanaerobaculia bacterium]|nr:L,D-transpeptidase family protein [Thermoanaerobaculia bacterium]